MKREDILKRLGFTVPESKKKRLIIHSDVKNEADDHFAIMQHLLTPSIDIKGIVAGHFEFMSANIRNMAATYGISEEEMKVRTKGLIAPRGTTMEMSFAEGEKILELAEIDDIPLIKGSKYEISDRNNLPESEGADFIIKEAMNEDERPLYVALLGCTTDLAIAYLKEPKIAEKVIAIWIGGGDYPDGGREFNLMQDVEAARILFESPMEIWQVPIGTYKTMEISLAELVKYIKPCGAIGAYLCEQMLEFNESRGRGELRGPFPHGESWCIGDNPTVSVLLQGSERICWHIEKAPFINDDLSYTPNPNGKEIRVYDSVDTRLTINDLFAKLELCYK